MQYARHAIYSTDGIKQALQPWARDHLLVAHVITRYDSVSISGKENVLVGEDRQILEVFKRPDATYDDIARATEMFLLKMCCANAHSTTLDKLSLILYLKKMNMSLSTFDLASLPPTSSAAKFHAYRAYFAVQEWLGTSGTNQVIFNDKDPAPPHILHMISCECKTGCDKRCMCRKSRLNCTEMCSNSIRLNCTNASPVHDNEDEQFGMTEHAQDLTVCTISAALMKLKFNKIAT